MADFLIALLELNLATAAAILLILMLRGPVRRLAGSEAAYALWLIAPVAAGASFLPSLRTVSVEQAEHGLQMFLDGQPLLSGLATAIWIGGALFMAAGVVVGQRRFMRQAARGKAGPAIVGFIDPRLVLPDDFESRFSPKEQALIRAHEKAHMDRDDPRANALVAALRCVGWFNPMVHMAAGVIRLDQELAADAAVVARFPRERRAYAETMLKTQLAEDVLPVGCYWPSEGRHPLEARIAMLRVAAPTAGRQLAGYAISGVMGLMAVAAVWTAQPPRLMDPTPPSKPQPIMEVMLFR